MQIYTATACRGKFFPPLYIVHLCTQMAHVFPITSLVIATFNWPQALEICLESILRQNKMPDEILIADDGSGKATHELIERFRSRFAVPVHHIWHPDEGFKLAKIRNKANVAARGEYIIQVDGDLILHPCFVKDHMTAAKPGYFIGGSRVIIDQEQSLRILHDKGIELNIFQKGISNRFNGIKVAALGKLASGIVKTTNAYNIRGCNMSYWRKDFLAVNGYNEEYTGWGREDTDLVFRFYHSGLHRRFFKFRGVAYHLWHKEADRSGLTQNDDILTHTIQTKAIRCGIGADQYLAESRH